MGEPHPEDLDSQPPLSQPQSPRIPGHAHRQSEHPSMHHDPYDPGVYAGTSAASSARGPRRDVGRAQPTMSNGLDLSFGYTPMQFEKINLIGSELSEHAISSLVLSVPNITYLDVRGNRLNAAFGWRLVKALKKRYLNLEFCNGVPLRALRDNEIESLNLANFSNHHGMYGMEVVGAIFLAHFLRLNSSLTHLNFRRNDVQKDGAKALAQSLLGNPQCMLRTVNTMGPTKKKGLGIDFAQFRTNLEKLTVVHLPRMMLDDDDFVFLEEWLRRFDCVTDLDISHNLIARDGVRKLTRYVKDTKALQKLNCCGLPVDVEGAALVAGAVTENETLTTVGLPIGRHDDNMLQQFGTRLGGHPRIQSIATNKTGLEWAGLLPVRENKIRAFPPERSGGWPQAQMAIFMWYLAALKPQLEQLTYGPPGRPTQEYPSCASAPQVPWPALVGVVHDLHRTLSRVSVAIPRGYGTRLVDLMRMLTRCSALRTLQLLGYASAALKEPQLPTDWTAIGVPNSPVGSTLRWLLEERLKKCRPHWQALSGLLNSLHLEKFNDVALRDGPQDQPELTCLLFLQCLEGVAADFAEQGASGEKRLVAHLQREADVEAFCDVLRLVRAPIHVELTFTDKSVEVVKSQQQRLAAPMSGVPPSEGHRFAHSISLRNNQVSEALLQSLDCHAMLREFGFESIGYEKAGVLPALFAALCSRDKPLPVERIRVEPKWTTQAFVPKRLSDRQWRWLDSVHAALVRSDRFVEIRSASAGSVSRQELEHMPPREFAQLLTGITLEELPGSEAYQAQAECRYFPSAKQFLSPDPDAEALFLPLPLPLDGDGQLQLQKLSLCMCNLRTHLVQTARRDAWAASSRVLWHGPRRFPALCEPSEEQHEELEDTADEENDSRPVRYHWREHLHIGKRRTCSMIAQIIDPSEPSFAETLLHDTLRSLLSEHYTLISIDLRGNGLTREDAELLLGLLQQHETLETLNMIPVTVDKAQVCKEISLDGTGIDMPVRPGQGFDNEDSYGGDGMDEEEPEGEAYARESLEADACRWDEGDGYIFLSLVTPQSFPELRSIALRRVEIPLDTTLAHITDALLNLPSVEQLHLSDLRLSSRGASLLLQAVVEMAPRLVSLNGLPLSRLVQLRGGAPEDALLELPSSVDWNDFPLGAMARLSLWPAAVFPPAQAVGSSGEEFRLVGRGLTDVGLRGLCVMLRHFAGHERASVPPPPKGGGGAFLHLARIDLGGNGEITDAAVADLCHTLQSPSMGSSLRHSLRELSVRSCPRLRARSAYELVNFLHHVREVLRDSSLTAPLGSSLQLLNGVHLDALQGPGRTSGAGTRAGGPPMLLRTFVALAGERHVQRLGGLATLSECDMHFFASVFHLFSSIPYCHVHIIVPTGATDGSDLHEGAPVDWGRARADEDENPFSVVSVSNDSPFPPPPRGARIAATVQAHLDAARRFFEACPISTQLRLSVVPCVPGCEDLLGQCDDPVLGVAPASEQSSSPTMVTLNRVKQRLQERAAKRRRSQRRKGGDAAPARPLYVNNINSQRLHCCFRTLYGKDDIELEHNDIIPDQRSSVSLPSEVDVTQIFGVATSVDLQHLDLSQSHFVGLAKVTEMPVLTHVNLNHNRLGNLGVKSLFDALVDAGCSVVHIAVASNNIGDDGASSVAASLGNLPRLTSLELCDNFIQERGSIALAEAIGGVAPPGEAGGGEEDAAAQAGPLPVLSVDLRGNWSRERGARRWAEVVCAHPDLKFLCLAQNELGCLTTEYFLDLVAAAVASAALSVLDLQNNFPQDPVQGMCAMGPPPASVVDELLADLPTGEFDPAEVRRAVFIRRHRGGGGRQSQHGQPNGVAQRHAAAQQPQQPQQPPQQQQQQQQ